MSKCSKNSNFFTQRISKCNWLLLLLFFRYKFWNNDPDVSLRFKIQDGRNSPEPAYTETKASILRRRNTLAKLRQKDAENGTNTG